MTEQSGFFSKFNRGEYQSAADSLKTKSEKEGKDQILYLLDRGTALFEDGEYKEAIEVLTKAERLSEVKDFTSINEEVVSVITTDTFKKFVPLDYERIMINVYLAVSYFMLGKYEDALVECRRINNLVAVLKDKGMKDFEESPLAWYISASIYEMQGKYDHARIDYSRVLAIEPSFEQAAYDAYRCAVYSNNMYLARDVQKKYPGLRLSDALKGRCKDCGDVLVLYSYGQIPIKRQSRYNSMLPEFHTRTHSDGNLSVYGDGGLLLGSGDVVLNLEDVARRNLAERINRIMAKRLLGVGTKVAIGYGVAKATKNEGLGILTGLLLQAATVPDTRGWSTLPKDFRIARIRLPKGPNTIDIRSQGASVLKKEINIEPKDLQIIPVRCD